MIGWRNNAELLFTLSIPSCTVSAQFPVAYTHLLGGLVKFVAFSLEVVNQSGNAGGQPLDPVSYTHLDVYKRQG